MVFPENSDLQSPYQDHVTHVAWNLRIVAKSPAIAEETEFDKEGNGYCDDGWNMKRVCLVAGFP